MSFANALDESLAAQILDERTSDRAVDLELVAKNGASDGEQLGHLGRELFVSLLFQKHFVVKFVLYLGLGPGLLLGLSTLLGGTTLGGLGSLGGALCQVLCTSLHLLSLQKVRGTALTISLTS